MRATSTRAFGAGYRSDRLPVEDAATTVTDNPRRAGYFRRDHFYLP